MLFLCANNYPIVDLFDISISLQCVAMENPCMFRVSKSMRKPLRFQQIKSIFVQIQRFAAPAEQQQQQQKD